MIVDILVNTPIWVYLLFCLLMYLGICNLKDKTTHALLLPILPSTFLIWGLFDVFSKSVDIALLWVWPCGVGIGGLSGWYLVRRHRITVNRQTLRIQIPGSPFVLLTSLIFFTMKYYIGVVVALSPESLDNHSFIMFVYSVSSVAVGLLVGRLLNYLMRFIRA